MYRRRLKVGKCTKCGEVVTTAPIPALGGAHQFNGSFTTVKERHVQRRD